MEPNLKVEEQRVRRKANRFGLWFVKERPGTRFTAGNGEPVTYAVLENNNVQEYTTQYGLTGVAAMEQYIDTYGERYGLAPVDRRRR